MSACVNLNVVGVKWKDKTRKTCRVCVRNEMDLLGLKRDWAQDRVKGRSLTCGETIQPMHGQMNMDVEC